MRTRRPRTWTALLLLGIISGPAAPATAGLSEETASAPGSVAGGSAPRLKDWTALRYTTSKLIIFSGEVAMTKSVAAGKLSIRTESRAKLFGATLVDSWSVSTLDAKTGRPLEFLSVRPGKRAERWSLAGERLGRTILKPHPEAPDEPLEQWAVTKSQTFPAIATNSEAAVASPAGVDAPRAGSEAAPATSTGTDADPSRWVHDYIAMIVRLRELPLGKVGDQVTVAVATSRGAVPMRVSVSEERIGSRSLTDLATGRSSRFRIRELRLRVTPLAGSTSETRGFLDMEGETELWVDAATRTLIEISGSVPKVPGRVVITLAGYR